MHEDFRIKNGKVGEDVPFQRVRRITGYLVGSVEKFNNAKRAEESERVKHGLRTAERKEESL